MRDGDAGAQARLAQLPALRAERLCARVVTIASKNSTVKLRFALILLLEHLHFRPCAGPTRCCAARRASSRRST